MDDAKKWSFGSNDALHISLKHPHDPAKDADFVPSFTYPIYGNEETIFGYQNLRINLNFHASTLQPEIEFAWSGKFEQVGDTAADDVEEPLKPYLPTIYDDKHNASAPKEASGFQPPGELVHQYEVKGRSFGIWTALLSDPRAKRIVRHMQILVPLFIEGGTCIELDDPEWTIERWRVFFLYEIDTRPAAPNDPTYLFAGYSTAYRLFFLDSAHPDYYSMTTTTTSDSKQEANNQDSKTLPLTPTSPQIASTLPCRQRISQFLITPPYQRSTHGHALYTTILSTLLSTPTTAEITVEDPNESFDALRDTADLHRLRSTLPLFSTLGFTTTTTTTTTKPPIATLLQKSKPIPFPSILPTTTIARIRSLTRLAPRQLARLLEMQLLSTIPVRHRSVSRITRKAQASDPNDRAYYFWRLMVKDRLFRHNRDVLMQIDGEERIERVEETVAGVEREYVGIMERVERWVAREREDGAASAAAGVGGGIDNGEEGTGDEEAANISAQMRKAKRKVIDDEDEDDENNKDDSDEKKAAAAAAAAPHPPTNTAGVDPINSTFSPTPNGQQRPPANKRQKTAEPVPEASSSNISTADTRKANGTGTTASGDTNGAKNADAGP